MKNEFSPPSPLLISKVHFNIIFSSISTYSIYKCARDYKHGDGEKHRVGVIYDNILKVDVEKILLTLQEYRLLSGPEYSQLLQRLSYPGYHTVVIYIYIYIYMKTLPPLTVGTINYRNVVTPVLNTEKSHRKNTGNQTLRKTKVEAE
jgi:hypothetical protein